jgi:peptide-methionine (S)-S-oxide reductase
MKAKVHTMLYWICSSIISFFTLTACAGKNQQAYMPEHLTENTSNKKLDTATFGAGCFWCVEAVFQRLEGVEKVVSGYGGGHIVNPTYEEVCSKTSGHVEICQIYFDPTVITYDELLEVFWKTHDPTTLDQQGNDVGPQYRSVVFYHNAKQKESAEYYKTKLQQSGAWDKPIVTTVEPFKTFYPAEAYHQDYYNQNGDQMYCRYVIQPKLDKFEKVFKDKLKKH